MAEIISLDEYRERRDPLASAIRRLDAAVARLDPLVRGQTTRLTPSIERELAAISGAVSAGDPREAAERAERLSDLLEHPAVGGGA
jgi:hypothetical protein